MTGAGLYMLDALVNLGGPLKRVDARLFSKKKAPARDEDTLTVAKIGGQTVTQTFPHVDSLGALAESFADAIEGRAPFLVSTTQMLDVIAGFEAVITSIKTREALMVGA
jgi:predicted dehydrogenase